MRVDIDEEPQLEVGAFLELAQRVWPGNYDSAAVSSALKRTINITARVSGRLVGSLRILTDGYFMGTIPEVLVDPDYRRRGIGRALLEAAWARSPTSLAFGAQPDNELFFLKGGFVPGVSSLQRRKPRGSPTGKVERAIEVGD